MLSSKNYLITFALGYNAQLDGLIKNERRLVIERTAPTQWRQTENRELGKYKYHSPWYAGNAICVLTNLEKLEFEFVRRNPFAVAGRCAAPGWSWKNFAKALLQERGDLKRAA
jgi:hypothetical protein